MGCDEEIRVCGIEVECDVEMRGVASRWGVCCRDEGCGSWYIFDERDIKESGHRGNGHGIANNHLLLWLI